MNRRDFLKMLEHEDTNGIVAELDNHDLGFLESQIFDEGLTAEQALQNFSKERWPQNLRRKPNRKDDC